MKKTSKCLRVGITGGIGSGKSTVCRMFEALGVPVYDADYWAKWLIAHDPAVKNAILGIFGPDAYLPDGAYNRALVSKAVFGDREKLEALNAAVHPALERHSRTWHDSQAGAGHAYTLKEAAVLIESGGHRYLDALIVVTAPEALRVKRVMARDGLSEAEVLARMRSQLPEEAKTEHADYLIVNDGRQMLIPQVWGLHRVLTAKSRE